MPRLNIPVHVPTGCKFCHSCKAVKLLSEFNKDRHIKDGLRTYCQPCDVVKATVAARKRRALNAAGERMTNPNGVTQAEREASNAAVVEALMDLEGQITEGIATKRAAPLAINPETAKRQRELALTAAVRAYRKSYNNPYPTPAAVQAFDNICGLR